MNEQEMAQNVVNEFIKMSLHLDKNQKWWIFNVAFQNIFVLNVVMI